MMAAFCQVDFRHAMPRPPAADSFAPGRCLPLGARCAGAAVKISARDFRLDFAAMTLAAPYGTPRTAGSRRRQLASPGRAA